jgi:hypothetical protein
MPERKYNPDHIADLPISVMVYPDQFINKLKYHFFSFYNPFHPFFRDVLLALRIIRHKGRQDFLLGKLKEEKSIDDFLSYLVERGFGNHFIAWVDDGEVASLRLVNGFEYQYHIRVFRDGEVRGHYEYTPECHPIGHLKETKMSDHRGEFFRILEGWITAEGK